MRELRAATVPQIRRMVQLRRAGLSHRAISIAMRVYGDGELAPDQVRSYCRRYAPECRSESHRERARRTGNLR